MREVTVLGRRIAYHTRDEWLQGRPFVTVTPPAQPDLVHTAMCHYPGASQNWTPPADTAEWMRFTDILYRTDPNRGYPYGYGFQIGINRIDWTADVVVFDLWEGRGFDRRVASNNGDFPPYSDFTDPNWNGRTNSCQVATSFGFWDANPEIRDDQILQFRYWVALCDQEYDETVDVKGHWETDWTGCPGPLRPYVEDGTLATRPDFWDPEDPPPTPEPPSTSLEDTMFICREDDNKYRVGDEVWYSLVDKQMAIGIIDRRVRAGNPLRDWRTAIAVSTLADVRDSPAIHQMGRNVDSVGPVS